MKRTIKQIYDSDDIIVSIGVFNPLTALLAEKIGFESAILVGWSLGAALGVTEPLTTMTETVDASRQICSVSNIPLSVDAGAGWGNATMIKRLVKNFEMAGVQGIHLEDQVVPKRIDYHKGMHYIVSAEEMMLKLDCAVKARSSEDFLIIARTDAGRNEGENFDHAIERAKLYAKSGADIVKVFARTEEEMINAPKLVDYPLWYVASEGLGRPIPTPAEAKAMGYKGISYPQTALQAAYRAVKQVYENIYNTGSSGVSKADAKKIADEIMGIIPIDELAHLDPQNLKLIKN